MSYSCLTCNCDVRSYPQKIWRSIRMAIQNHVMAKNKKIYFISISALTRKICMQLMNDSRKIYTIADPVEINENQLPNKLLNNDVYLFMGRLSPEKGIGLFCQAVTDLNRKGIVLGEGYLRSELMENILIYNLLGGLQVKINKPTLKKQKLWSSLRYVMKRLVYRWRKLGLMEFLV